MKISKDIEELFDLESARKANEIDECNDCFSCDCYDPDLGCTMPSIHKDYACSLYNNGEPQC